MVIDAAVRWNLRWANLPDLEFLLEADPNDKWASPIPRDLPRHAFAVDGECRPCRVQQSWKERAERGEPTHYHSTTGPDPDCERCSGTRVERYGTFYIVRQAPCIRFVFENAFNGGGALGGRFAIVGGGWVQTNGGWSSNGGAVNKLRQTDERFAELLPEPIVEATYTRGDWDQLGMAGLCWDLSFCQEQVEKYLPGVELVGQEGPSDMMASSDQSAIIVAGTDELREDERGEFFIPYPVNVHERIVSGELTRSGKPQEDSDLYRATSEELKRAQARARTNAARSTR